MKNEILPLLLFFGINYAVYSWNTITGIIMCILGLWSIFFGPAGLRSRLKMSENEREELMKTLRKTVGIKD